MYHHFTGNNLNRSEKIQKQVIDRLLASKIPDSNRENSIAWELKHSSSTIQLAKILAEKRGLNTEYAEIIAALHDISAIETGSYEKHAAKGAEIAGKILMESGDFSNEEIDVIVEAIANHSEKQTYTDKKYVELAKDADTLDCFLYDQDIYHEKPAESKKEYFKRIIKIRKELGLPENKFFREQLKALK